MIKKLTLTLPVIQCIIALIIIFIIDLIIPLGVAVGVLYVFCIALLINESQKRIFIFSVAISILILLIPIVTTTNQTTWMAYVNRGISIASIWIAFFMAIKHKKLNNKLELYTSQLEQKNRELELFFYKTSHDLKAPFSRLEGILNLCDLRVDPVCFLHKSHMRNTLVSANKLLTDISHISTIYNPELKISKINFEEALENVLKSLEYLQDKSKVEIRTKISVKTTFYSDISLIASILRNLIQNSLLFSELNKNGNDDFSRTPSFVYIKIIETKNGLLIQVEDNGEGIKQEYLNNIFEMFFRGSDKKGSGLGLYIVKSAVKKLSGKVAVTSKYGEGAIFRISLPNLWGKEEEGISVSLLSLN